MPMIVTSLTAYPKERQKTVSNPHNIEKALEITQNVAKKLYNGKYRNIIHDWDEFYSTACFQILHKFHKYDPSIGTFAGYITMHVTFVAKTMVKESMRPGARSAKNTIEDVMFESIQVPEDLDWVLRRVAELSEHVRHNNRAATIRSTIRKDMQALGWSKSRIEEAFETIAEAVSPSEVQSLAKDC